MTNEASTFNNIYEAAGRGTVQDVKYFIEKRGVDVNARNSDSFTPLHIAVAQNRNVDVLKYLIEKGADVNAKIVVYMDGKKWMMYQRHYTWH